MAQVDELSCRKIIARLFNTDDTMAADAMKTQGNRGGGY